MENIHKEDGDSSESPRPGFSTIVKPVCGKARPTVQLRD